jgi:hypothetical protein
VVAAGRWPQAARLQLAHLDLTERGNHGSRWSSAAAAPPVLDAARGGAPRAGGQQTSTAATSMTATPQPQDSAPAAASASCFPSSFTGTPRGGAPPPRAKAKLEQASRPPGRARRCSSDVLCGVRGRSDGGRSVEFALAVLCSLELTRISPFSARGRRRLCRCGRELGRGERDPYLGSHLARTQIGCLVWVLRWRLVFSSK